VLGWLVVPKIADVKQTTDECLGLTVLSSMILALLKIIDEIEQNPGPFVEVENTGRLTLVLINP
jgi:hypothetical protein